MKIFLITYHAIPTEKVEDYKTQAGAFVNCFIEADNIYNGLKKAEEEIKKVHWTDLEFQDAVIADLENLDSDKIEYYEQALIDKEVLVFYCYPIVEEEEEEENETNLSEFKLWLEFEEIEPGNWDIDNEACNIHVDLPDGRHYGINVWTYNFLQTAIDDDKKTGQNLNGLYQKPPDLFVTELTRECIQQTIEDLLKIGDLEIVLNPSIYDK